MRPARIALLIALPLLLFGMVVAACDNNAAQSGIASANGGSQRQSSTASTTASVDPHTQGVRFAQCMRQHGVNVQDPDSAGTSGSMVRKTGSANANGGPAAQMNANGVTMNPNDPKTKAAMNACRSLLPNGGAPPSMNPQQVSQMREYAQCMRAHGVNMPDPDSSGIVHQSGNDAGGLSLGPNDPTFKAAAKACQSKLPSGGGLEISDGGNK